MRQNQQFCVSFEPEATYVVNSVELYFEQKIVLLKIIQESSAITDVFYDMEV